MHSWYKGMDQKKISKQHVSSYDPSTEKEKYHNVEIKKHFQENKLTSWTRGVLLSF